MGSLQILTMCCADNVCQFHVPQVSDDTLTAIFGTILDWHLTTQSFPDAIKALSKDLVAATLAVYSTAASKLLPTPAKSHYLFNLRDFARVVQVRPDASTTGLMP